MTGIPDYIEALDTAENGGIAGRINSFSGGTAAGAIPVSALAIVGSAFAGSPTMAVLSGAGGVGATVLGGAGYAATRQRASRNREAGAGQLRGFEPVDAGENVLDALAPDDIDTVRYNTNTGFRKQDADFVLDEERVAEEDGYTLLKQMEEDGDPTYLLREDGYRFTLTAVNTPYWNSYSHDAMDDSFRSCGNYEVLEVAGDSRNGLDLATAPVTGEDVVDAYTEATFS